MPTRVEAMREIVESSFAPLACTFFIEQSCASLRIHQPSDDSTLLFVTGIPFDSFDSLASVHKLIDEVRSELRFSTEQSRISQA